MPGLCNGLRYVIDLNDQQLCHHVATCEKHQYVMRQSLDY